MASQAVTSDDGAREGITSPHHTAADTVSRTQLVLWVIAVAGVNTYPVYGIPLGYALPVIGISVAAATSLAIQMTRRPPQDNLTRVWAYLLAFLANQTVAVFAAAIALLPSVPIGAGPLTAAAIGYVVCCAVLACWTFLLVRAWLSRGRRNAFTPARSSRPARVLSGLAAAGAVWIVLVAANIIHGLLISRLGTSESAFTFDQGGTTEWLITTIVVGLAGAVEEPVFVGVAMLLWPRMRKGNFVLVAVVTTLARSSIHIYYAAGASMVFAVITVVIIWCAIWSTFNLYVVYRCRRLWPVIVAHGLQNAFAVAAGSWVVTNPAIANGVSLLMLAALAVIAVGTLAYLATRLRAVLTS